MLHRIHISCVIGVILMALLAGCASAPQPAMPDGKARRPVNTPAAMRAYQDSLRDGEKAFPAIPVTSRSPAASGAIRTAQRHTAPPEKRSGSISRTTTLAGAATIKALSAHHRPAGTLRATSDRNQLRKPDRTMRQQRSTTMHQGAYALVPALTHP